MQIINNVAEEFADLGQTNFATKKELCQVILWLRESDGKQIQDLTHAVQLKKLEYIKQLIGAGCDDNYNLYLPKTQ